MNTKELEKKYFELFTFLRHTVHELPVGILFDMDGANEKQFKELMQNTYRLEELSKLLDRDSPEFAEFIQDCRWHYERYPHYLGRHRHFNGYESYIIKYKGPVRV